MVWASETFENPTFSLVFKWFTSLDHFIFINKIVIRYVNGLG